MACSGSRPEAPLPDPPLDRRSRLPFLHRRAAELERPLRDELASVEQLEERAKALAGRFTLDPDLRRGGDRTYRRLDDNARLLDTAYRILADDVHHGEVVTSAAEWILDNFHLVASEIRGVRQNLPRGYYRELPKLAARDLAGTPRVYALAVELIRHSDSLLERGQLVRFLNSFQSVAPLTIGELWAWPSMLRLALIENLRRLAAKTLEGRAARRAADSYVARIDAAGRGELPPLPQVLHTAFVVQLLRRIREYGPRLQAIRSAVDDHLATLGMSAEDAIRAEHQGQAAAQVSVANVISSLRLCSTLDWSEYFEAVSLVERVLEQDPPGVYGRMDFQSRDRYRQAVEELAGRSGEAQIRVARRAVESAREAADEGSMGDRAAHVGHHLIGKGRRGLEDDVAYRPHLRRRMRRFAYAHATALYLGALGVVTALLVGLGVALAWQAGAGPTMQAAVALLLLVPASELATAWVQRMVAWLAPPRRLPRLDLAGGVPAEARTLVVVPTLWSSVEDAEELVAHLEVLALGNLDPHIHFALLADFPDAAAAEMPGDAAVLAAARAGIEALNARHGREGRGDRFFLFHRERQWNPGEGTWMGWERKRGKLEELNGLLRGPIETGLRVEVGAAHTGPLGRGWTFSYGESVEERPDGAVLYRESDGTEHVFAPDGNGGYGVPPGKHLALSGDSAAGWSLRSKDGLVSRFAGDGRLLSIEDPNGNRVTLGYDAARLLQTVTDAAGRTVLTVTGDAGRVTGVTDLSGRTIAYAYDGPDLVAVTDTVGETWTYAYDETGNLLARTDPLGNTDSYAHDALDRCYRHVDPLGHEERFSYSRRGERAVLTDRRGFDTYLEFDERGRATLQVDPLGNASRSSWDEANNRASTIDPRGGVTTRTFDERGNLLTETNPLNETTAYTYDPVLNRVLTTSDPAGHVVTNTYDSAGNLTETRQTVAGQLVVESYGYDGHGQLVERTDANGHATTYAWDSTKGSLASQTDALGHTTTIASDDFGRVTAITDPAGNAMTVEWDGRDRLVSTTDPHGNSISIGFDAAGRQVSLTTPRGTSTTAYDAAGRPIAATDVLGHTSRTVYDPAGLPIERIDALGHATATTYDAVGRAASQVDPLGATWTFGYCAEIGGGGGCTGGSCGGSGGGDICELTDPLGNTTVQDFDAVGRVFRRTDPLGHVTLLAYDERGRHVATTDPLGKLTRYEYDHLDRLAAVIEANGARTEYTYDPAGNLTNVHDAEGRHWPRTYDELGRQLTEADPLGHTTTSTYDLLGNLTTRTNTNGDLLRYEYDVRRLTANVLPDGSRETSGYDPLGRRTAMANSEVSLTMVYDALDRVTAVTNQTLGQTLGYEYDAVGNRTAIVGPLGRIVYRHDARRQLVEQVDPVTGTYRLAYDAAGRRTGLTYPNGVATEYVYDRASQLLTLLTRDPAGLVLDGFGYAYDPAGRRTEMRSLRDDVLHAYVYDEVDRLTRWQRGDSRFEQYGYDRVGNRLSLLDDRGSVTYSYDTANRLLGELRQHSEGGSTTTAYTWDDAGRLLSRQIADGATTTHTWDALDRLVTLDGPTGHHTYGYDPTGIRVRETNGTTTNRFLHAGEDILAVYRDANLDTYFAHGPGIDEPWAQLAPGAADSPLAFLHRDALGSVTALSTPDGALHATASYAAFGSVETSSGSTGRYGYTSREADPTGLMYYRARYYRPETGRFVSRDPFRGEASEPESLHGYSYVHQNPIALSDPQGLAPDAEEPLILGDGDYVGLLIFVSPYLLILALLARLAARTARPIAALYFAAMYAWMGTIFMLLELWLISVASHLGRDGQRFTAYVNRLALIGLNVYLAGMAYLYRAVAWVQAGTFLAFTVFLYWLCVKVLPAGNPLDAVVGRDTLICGAIALYIWSVARLPKAPPKDL